MAADILLPLRLADLDQGRDAAAYLRYVVERADIVRHDRLGRPVMRFEFPCPPWLQDKLAAVGADAAELEDDDGEEEAVE